MNEKINKKLAINKGLILDNNFDLYIKLENLYKNLFEKYLNTKINLNIYDEKLKNSDLDFGLPSPTKKQLTSGLNEYLDLKYIYILNNFFIEKLDNEDINSLKDELEKDVIDLNENLINIIERTYKEIINNNYYKGSYIEKNYNVCYGDITLDSYAPNNALVLKIFYGKNTKEFNHEEFIKNIKEKKIFLQKFSEELKEEIEKNLNIKCVVFNEKISN